MPVGVELDDAEPPLLRHLHPGDEALHSPRRAGAVPAHEHEGCGRGRERRLLEGRECTSMSSGGALRRRSRNAAGVSPERGRGILEDDTEEEERDDQRESA